MMTGWNRVGGTVVGVIAAIVAVGLFSMPAEKTSATTIVLRSGGRVEVASASLRGDQVVVSLGDGRLMAYPASEVDLEASGLRAAGTPVPAGAATPPPELARPGGRLGTAGAAGGEPRNVISDRDVAHVEDVRPEAAPLPEGDVNLSGAAEIVPTGAVSVTTARFALRNTILQVTGVVANRGRAIASGVTVTAEAIGAEGADAGHGSTEITDPIAEGLSVRFTVEFEVSGMPERVRVYTGSGATIPTPEPMLNIPAGEKPPAEEAGGEQ